MMRASWTASSTSAMILTLGGSTSSTWAARSISRVKRSLQVTSASTAPHLPCPIVFVSSEGFWRPQAHVGPRAHRGRNGAVPHREAMGRRASCAISAFLGHRMASRRLYGSVRSHHHMLWWVLLACSIAANATGTLPPPSNRSRAPFARVSLHPTVRVVLCWLVVCTLPGGRCSKSLFNL